LGARRGVDRIERTVGVGSGTHVSSARHRGLISFQLPAVSPLAGQASRIGGVPRTRRVRGEGAPVLTNPKGVCTACRRLVAGSYVFALLSIEHMFDRLDFLWKMLATLFPDRAT